MDHALTLTPKRGPAVGFALLLALLALVAAGKAVLADTLDPDCFWHLRIGQELTRQGWPTPLVDNLSFASIRTPWTPYSWLAEVGMQKLWDVGGYRAAVAAQAAIEAAFILLLGLGALQASRSANGGQPAYLASALAAAVGGFLSLAYLSFRPVTTALVLLALIAWLLLRDRRLQQKSRAVWLVPPLTALLINIHFFALLVPLWTAALFVGDAVERRTRLWRGAVLTALATLACAMTPLLPGTMTSVWAYATRDVMVHGGTIAEMRPFYVGIMGHLTAAFVLLLPIFLIRQWIISRRTQSPPRIGLGEILWLVGSTLLLFRLGRMAPVFAIIAAPALAVALPQFSDRILARKPIIALLAAAVALTAWQVARGFPAPSQSLSAWLDRHGPDLPGYPCAAADFVDLHVPRVTGHLICEFTWGGYLEWRLGPRFQVLMDGRTQLFSPNFWQATQLGSIEQRQRYLARTRADAAILPKHRGTFAPILTDLGWTTVYEDDYAKVMVPPPKSEMSDRK